MVLLSNPDLSMLFKDVMNAQRGSSCIISWWRDYDIPYIAYAKARDGFGILFRMRKIVYSDYHCRGWYNR